MEVYEDKKNIIEELSTCPNCGGGISGQKEKSFYMVDRNFFEKLVALLNHSTSPLMDIFRVDKKVKRRIVIDYDPQAPKIEFKYYEEDTG